MSVTPSLVVVDTSVFSRFNDIGLASKLRDCLPRAVITPEVQDELRRGQGKNLAALRNIAAATDWPRCEVLDSVRKRDLANHAAMNRLLGDPLTKNLGEISVVLMAGQIGAALIAMDDSLGVKLAKRRGIPHRNTAEIAADAAVASILTVVEARAVFNVAAAAGHGHSDWDIALREADARG